MNATAQSDATRFEPPDDATVERAIADYARLVRDAYGSRLKGIYLFGSRARGDHTSESDVDIAVVLGDENWDFWGELFRLSDLGYDLVVETGAEIHGYPLKQAVWNNPDSHTNPRFIRSIRRDGRPLLLAA